jgi:FAD/FMN-containing dehydrogenase
MTEITFVGLDGGKVTVEGSVIQTLTNDLRGPAVRPGEPGYDEARTLYNAMIDNKPALTLRCAGVADVIAGVKFAATHRVLVSVRGGGHNVAGNAVCDGGLMLDLSAMNSVRVDPNARIAYAEGGATWADYDAETQAFGLGSTGGLISSTGVGGLTLGGGIGWLQGKHGLACDNVVAFDMVTARGQLVRASADENVDLYWGLRGGGGNFGVVVSFEFALHEIGPFLAGMLFYPLAEAKQALAAFRDFWADAPDELGALAGLVTAPDGSPVLALVMVYNGDPDEGARVLQRMRAFGPPMMDTIGPMPYRQVQTLFDEGAPPGLRNYWKSSFLERLPEEAIDTLVAQRTAMPSPRSKLFIECLNGAMARVGRDETAFDHREVPFNLLILGAWEDGAADETNIAWARETIEVMQPYASAGVYVNYLGQETDEGSDRLRASYGPAKYDRLVALKTKYDPGNLFRMNQNIKPGKA